MACYEQYFVIVPLILQICAVYGNDEIIKSSLTFVIDDTASMAGEIRQVKDEVNIIFEKVLSSNASQIENFVLVTFNDPTAQVRTKTKNRDEFKRNVAAIHVHGGDDCPEFALTGIELALKESLPLSYLYVFTDASAKDHYRFDQIKSISQKKQSQVVFVLTGECGGRSGADYQVYHKVAKATNGQVFHMMKDDVKDILKYIEESITSRGTVLVNEYYKPGYNNNIKYTVDSYTGDILISVTGERPKIMEIRGPGGSKPTTELIVTKSGILIAKVTGSMLGDYELVLGSESETHVVITAKSNLNFQLGFSVDKPNSMKDTVTKPAPDGNAFLGIRLLGSGVKFTTAKILDMSGNVITELPLELTDEKTQFYTSPSFSPPFTMFRVAVSGLDVATKSPIARISPTPIERQNPATETKENRAPQVTIDGSPTIITEYDAPLRLKCNVHGYPAPDVIWEEKDTGIRIPAKVQVHEVPYDYVSILDIDKANKNVTYQCKAKNTVDVDIKYIQVVTKRKIYFNVTESPKDIIVKYNKEGSLVCKVDSYPPATITWYKDGATVSEDSNIVISSDKSILTIKYMQVDLQGKYTCEARNDFDRKVFIATVAIIGVEKPVIDKSLEEVRVIENTNAALSCRILKGIPKPSISWSFQPAGEDTFRVMVETSETIYVNNVDRDRSGLYKCRAQNVLGSDSFTTELFVEYPPKIKKDLDNISKQDGEEVRISCDVTGFPVPAVKWLLNDTELVSSAIKRISSDHSLNFKVTPADMGYYTCEAQNKHGLVNKLVFLNVLEKPAIDKSNKEINVEQKTNVALSCGILQGNPEPNIRWYYQPPGSTTFKATTETSKTLRLYNVGKDKTGSYKCTATNSVGEDQFTMELVVEYPPTIKENLKEITSKDDDEVRISCDTTGEPTPTVTWFFNNTAFDSTAKRRISVDQGLRFNARLVDIGNYTCEAVNKLGSAKKTTFLNVYIPVKIETPKNSRKEVMVGKSHILDCRADGYPKPNIKWTFQSSDPMIPATDITPTADVGSLPLKNMQLDQQGSYTCEAENGIGGSAKITYDVKVYAPPVINNLYLTKAFEALAGDQLEIQCRATGSPKPSIVWIKDGLYLAIGSDWYDMKDDGTLVIKKIRRDSEGTYVCLAQNILGNDTEAYEVIVRDSLLPDIPTNTVFIREGETKDINCDIPHNSTDQIRWYKNGVVIATEELTLYSVSRSDDGLYTCRINNGTKAHTATTKVVIGFKPRFSFEVEDTVDFVHGADTQFLSCDAYGEPKPKTAIWKHNGKELDTTSMSYPLGMEYRAIGTYECEVSNDFGSIHRTFTVTSRACILDIKRDFPEKQPIMCSPSLGWPEFHKENGYMIIPPHSYFFFNCPSQFSNSDLPLDSNLMAFCEQDNIIKIYGNKYKFSDIQCEEEVKPEVEETGIKCLPGNTEFVKIGYRVYSVFIEVYEVCLDKDNNVPLFSKHSISPHHTNRSTEAEWTNSVLPQDFDTLYDCRRQAYDISSALGRGLRTRDSCCFGKRQLVNSRDLLPGIPTSAAYEYLNVVPHWSTCNSKNWENVEQSVRKLVKKGGRNLVITTGTANPRRAGSSTDITLHDGLGRGQTVAPYLWKVVQDPAERSSIAIIQVNIPELSDEEALEHVLCLDICRELTAWMDPSNYDNVGDGYTYCCSITEFEKAFGYNKRFSTYTYLPLYDVDKMLAGSVA